MNDFLGQPMQEEPNPFLEKNLNRLRLIVQTNFQIVHLSQAALLAMTNQTYEAANNSYKKMLEAGGDTTIGLLSQVQQQAMEAVEEMRKNLPLYW